MEIYLIRHTKVALPANICYGQCDVSLAETFETDIENVIIKLNLKKEFLCYTSPLTRCHKLANEIADNLITENRLMELNFGDWEMKSWHEIGKQAFDAWHSDFVNNQVPNGESYFELYKRTTSFIEEIKQVNNDHLLVTHGGVIRAILSYALGLPLENSFRLKIDFGSISKIKLDNDMIQVEFINH